MPRLYFCIVIFSGEFFDTTEKQNNKTARLVGRAVGIPQSFGAYRPNDPKRHLRKSKTLPTSYFLREK